MEKKKITLYRKKFKNSFISHYDKKNCNDKYEQNSKRGKEKCKEQKINENHR